MEKEQKVVVSDIIFIFYKWRKFLILNLIVIGIITGIAVFLIPNQYKATTTIMIPPDSQIGLGGLSNLLGGKSSIASMGSKLFGTANTTEDLLLGILNSRTALTEVIKHFDLMKYYEIDDNNFDKAISSLRADISSDPNEYGMIEFNIVNKDPDLSARIANYLVQLVDSINIELNIERARNNRLFIEKRYLKNIADLKIAEDSLYRFQKKFGIVAVPEQLEVSVKAAAEVEAMLSKKEMESQFSKELYGENSPHYQAVNAEIKMLRGKVQELKNSSSLESTSNILYPFRAMPDIAIQYLRAFREVELQQTILEFVMPMYEQAKVEEQKSVPTVMIIDKATPPRLKNSPKRISLVIGVLALSLFIFIPLVFVGEKAIVRDNHTNSLQIKLSNIFKALARIYKINV